MSCLLFSSINNGLLKILRVAAKQLFFELRCAVKLGKRTRVPFSELGCAFYDA